MGIERSESIRISAKNDTDIMPGMVFFLSINLEGLPNKKKSGTEGARSLDKFSFALGDTVLVLPEKDATTDLHCASLTRGASSSSKSMIFRRREGGSDDEDMLDGLDVDASLAERTSRAAAAGASKEKHTAEKQRKLMLQKKAEYEAAKKNKANTIPSIEDITKQMRMFSTAADYPRRARKLKVFLDTDRETVFIPVNRVPVPFHISTIKSVSYTKQGRNHILRFNFHTTSRKSVDATKIMNHYCAQSQNMTFIKEIMVKSLNPVNLNAQCRQIKEMQKNNRALIKQAIEESNLVAQDRVRLITNPPKLQDLQMKPSLRGRRTTGTLECHHNGLRFRSSTGGERLEFTFKNIRHAMFQPCKKELTVLIHFHLKNPILVGKKKAVDIQFYTEVVRSSEAIAKRASMYDPEEMDAERRQNKLRKRLNELFDSFVKKCEKLVEQIGEEKLQFDVPFRDIGFEGVPHKSKCLLMPTQEALVNLTEQPVFVISLALVDHVHLARCTFKSRHFDMVIIWKDWSRTPATIDMIDRQSLDHIKRWLEDYPLSFTMGPDTLKIKSIMKMAQQYLDEGSFFEEVDKEGYKKGIGWEFLVPQAEEDEDQESDDESEFKSEDESSGSEDEDSDEWEATDEEEESEAEEISDAEDWDDMEKQAAHEDRKKSQKHDAYEARLEQKEQAAQRRAKRKRRNR
jgi:nucleosome binding factor SPN SPT16 subunit